MESAEVIARSHAREAQHRLIQLLSISLVHLSVDEEHFGVLHAARERAVALVEDGRYHHCYRTCLAALLLGSDGVDVTFGEKSHTVGLQHIFSLGIVVVDAYEAAF